MIRAAWTAARVPARRGQYVEALEKVGIHVPLDELLACYTPLLQFAQRGQSIGEMVAEEKTITTRFNEVAVDVKMEEERITGVITRPCWAAPLSLKKLQVST